MELKDNKIVQKKNTYHYKTPIGTICIEDNGRAITALYIDEKIDEELENETDLIKNTYLQLNEYFNKKRTKFDVPVELNGTVFQKQVWDALKAIPYGNTCSYKDIAERINNPKAVRAVGGANNKNPVMIIVPCHRVIGKNGDLVGFGCGIEVKKYLLELEGIIK